MKLIKLSRGLFAQVDDEDYEYLNQWKWSANKDGYTYYAIRCEYYSADPTLKHQKQKSKCIKMHRLLLGLTDPKIKGDHKDRNGLNNQRSNLRIATNSQNNANRKSRGSSKYLGVSKITNKNLWSVQINKNNKSTYIGTFKTEIEAAVAYDTIAKEVFGEFANLNFKE